MRGDERVIFRLKWTMICAYYKVTLFVIEEGWPWVDKDVPRFQVPSSKDGVGVCVGGLLLHMVRERVSVGDRWGSRGGLGRLAS